MGSITDVSGIQVGHFTDSLGKSGCTVIICAPGAVPGVDVHGTALGTHEIDLIRSGVLVNRVQAVLLTGGSSYGLQAARGVMRFLEERRQGFRMSSVVVPIVAAASINDLGRGPYIPDEEAGYAACSVSTSSVVGEGAVGAGAGALIGLRYGPDHASAGGIATAGVKRADYTLGVLVVVNCAGSVLDPRTRATLAGARNPATGRMDADVGMGDASFDLAAGTGNLIACVATDALLSKQQAHEVARLASSGFFRAAQPLLPAADGVIVFALSTAMDSADLVSSNLVGAIGANAADLVAEATCRVVDVRKSRSP